MKKANTVTAVLAYENGSFDKRTVSNLPTLPIKSKATRDGRMLAYIIQHEATNMESFISLFEATAREYPFHRDELNKAFWEAL